MAAASVGRQRRVFRKLVDCCRDHIRRAGAGLLAADIVAGRDRWRMLLGFRHDRNSFDH